MEMPFKLLLMFALLGMLIPTAAYGYRDISRIRLERRIEESIQSILFEAKRVSNQGDLSRVIVEFDTRGGQMASVDYVRFGDSVGDQSLTITYKMGWWKHDSHIFMEDLSMTSINNNTFTMRGGNKYELALTKITVAEGAVVVITPSTTYVDPGSFR